MTTWRAGWNVDCAAGTAIVSSGGVPAGGKVYFEVTHIASASWGRLCIGVANKTFNLAKPQALDVSAGAYATLNGCGFVTLQNNSNSVSWSGNPGNQPAVIGAVTYSGTTPVIGIAVDTVNGLMWMRDASGAPNTWYGLITAFTPDPVAGVYGWPLAHGGIGGSDNIYILMGVTHESGNAGTPSFTLNAGATAFTGTIPTGWLAWDATGYTVLSPADIGGTDISISGGGLTLSFPNPGIADANGPAEYVRSNTFKGRV